MDLHVLLFNQLFLNTAVHQVSIMMFIYRPFNIWTSNDHTKAGKYYCTEVVRNLVVVCKGNEKLGPSGLFLRPALLYNLHSCSSIQYEHLSGNKFCLDLSDPTCNFLHRIWQIFMSGMTVILKSFFTLLPSLLFATVLQLNSVIHA